MRGKLTGTAADRAKVASARRRVITEGSRWWHCRRGPPCFNGLTVMRYVSQLEVLRALGIELSLDWDDQLILRAPSRIEYDEIKKVAEKYNDVFIHDLQGERRRALSVCVGGPKNGQRHGWSGAWNKIHCVNVHRACWAVYEIQDDGRAFFRGYAKSRKKARQLDLYESAVKRPPSTKEDQT